MTEVELHPITLTTRRARFVYEAARLQAIAVDAPIVPEPWSDRDEKFRKQFLEIIDRQMGPMRSSSPAELHGGWVQAYIEMGWTYGLEHQLEQREQDKDAVFIALCEIARLWINHHTCTPDYQNGVCSTCGVPAG